MAERNRVASYGLASRRSFLTRSLAFVVGTSASGLLVSCSQEQAPPTVVPLFSQDHVLVAGSPQRIPIAIVAGENLPDDDAAVTVAIGFNGETVDTLTVQGRVVDHDHVGELDPSHQHADLFRYYPIRTTLDKPGIYDISIAFDGSEAVLPVQVFDRSEVLLPVVGDDFPRIATPTFERPEGVDRLCTRLDPCPFHTTSVDQALDTGRPLAVLVATPAFCSTAYCGPVLETMITASDRFPDVDVVHLEVYANTDEVDGNFQDPGIRLAPAVVELGLAFEPSLFLVSAQGRIVDRIDNVFDGVELAEALSSLIA